MKLKSDIKKIEKLLRLNGMNWSSMAERLRISKQLMSYHVTRETIQLAEIVAPVLGLNPKDLIK